jgi:hypothetical protein
LICCFWCQHPTPFSLPSHACPTLSREQPPKSSRVVWLGTPFVIKCCSYSRTALPNKAWRGPIESKINGRGRRLLASQIFAPPPETSNWNPLMGRTQFLSRLCAVS